VRERERVIDIRRTIILNSFVKKIQIIVVFVCIYSVIPTYVYILLLNSGTLLISPDSQVYLVWKEQTALKRYIKIRKRTKRRINIF